MTKYSNIYDIDGNIIRRADQGAFTLEETEQLVDDLTKKVQENPDNEVYKVYLNNAHKWLFKLYNEMKPGDIMKRMSALQNSVEEAKTASNEIEKEQLDELNKIMDEFKKTYEKEPEPSEIVMDEVVTDYEEVKDE